MTCGRSLRNDVRDYFMRYFYLSDGLNSVSLFFAFDCVSDDILLCNYVGKGVNHYRIRSLCHSRLQRVRSCRVRKRRRLGDNHRLVRLSCWRNWLRLWFRNYRFLFNDGRRRMALIIKRFLEQIECKGNK